MREVDRVAEQVGRRAVPAFVEPVAPRQRVQRVAAVHREEAAAVVGDLAQPAVGDQLPGVLHERRPAVVVTDARGHLPRRLGRALGLLRRAAHRLLAEDVLARRRGRLDQLEVEHVRRGDVDDVDFLVLDHAPPVGRRLGVAEGLDRLALPRRHVVCADHELGLEFAVGEQGRDPQQRAAVGLAEPAEADQADADSGALPAADLLGGGRQLCHQVTCSSSCVSCSSSAPPAIIFTSSSRLMPPLSHEPSILPRLRTTKRSPTGHA